ncbi:hypothetical protein D3C81_2122790 [compost metagenome]
MRWHASPQLGHWGWDRTQASGSWRISTLEVSRWMRSCSVPIRMTQAGLCQSMGRVSGICWMKSITRVRTLAR